MDRFTKAQKAAEVFANNLDKRGIISIVRIGSSLRREDFCSGSDIDFLIIQQKSPKHFLENDSQDGFEIHMVRRGKKAFLDSLDKGVPLDLVAMQYGVIVYDKNRFFLKAKRKNHPPTKTTIEQWMHTAAFHLGDAAMTYSWPIDLYDYFKHLHHSARESCRAIIAKEQKRVVEGDLQVLDALKEHHLKVYGNYRKIVLARKRWESFSAKDVNSLIIKDRGRGKYLLLTLECVAESWRICKGARMPPINSLIGKIAGKYPVKEFNMFQIYPKECKLLLFFKAKGGGVRIFSYDCKTDILKEQG